MRPGFFSHFRMTIAAALTVPASFTGDSNVER
jgi:hypothetical protein